MTLSDVLEQELIDNTFIIEGLEFQVFPWILAGNVIKQKFLKKKIVNNKQRAVLKYIYKVYGNDIARAILNFKKKIINPFNSIKERLEKKQRISSKDLSGMTKEEFLSNLESGRKKIQARGEPYFKKVENTQERLNLYRDRLEALTQARNEFKGPGTDGVFKIDYNIMNKVYNKFNISFKDDDRTDLGLQGTRIDNFGRLHGDDDEDRLGSDKSGSDKLDRLLYDKLKKEQGYTRHQFDLIYNRITKEYETLVKANERLNKQDTDLTQEQRERMQKHSKRLKELWAGQNLDLIKSNKGEFYKDRKFKENLAKYFFSRDILNRVKKIENATGSNLFRNTYLTIIKESQESVRSKREKLLQDLITLKKSIKFTEKEEKIWEKRGTIKNFSNKLEDYIQKVDEDDFLEKPIYVQKTPEMKSIEDTIENESRKFFRRLSQIVSEEDLNKLKEVGLVGKKGTSKIVLDKMGDNIFKSDDQIRSSIEKEGKDAEEPDDEKKKEDYINADDYHRRLREIATIKYENVISLNRAKKEAEILKQIMIKQGDKKVTDEHENLLNQIKYRKSISAPKTIRGEEIEARDLLDIDTVQRTLQRMIKRKYKNPSEIRADKAKYDRLVKRYRDEVGSDTAEIELEDIKFLEDQYRRKITEYQYGE